MFLFADGNSKFVNDIMLLENVPYVLAVVQSQSLKLKRFELLFRTVTYNNLIHPTFLPSLPHPC